MEQLDADIDLLMDTRTGDFPLKFLASNRILLV